MKNPSQRKAWGSSILILLLCVISPLVCAQNFRGGLVGIVEDSQGGRVPSAQVVLQAAESNLERLTTSNGEGEFGLADLPPGAYHVIVSAKGFQEARSDVMIVVSSVLKITVQMKPEALRQNINVQGQSSSITTEPIDTASAVHQGAITLQDLQTIPLAHRSFANIAYLVPGTEPVEPSDPTKARITAVSSGGSSGLNIELSVDGGDNSDDYIGGFLQNFSPDAIQQFSIRTAQMDADTSRTTGSSVVIMTRRGTDDWHGDAAFYERAAELNARYPIDNPAPNPKQPFSRQNYVGTFGGPIQKGKLWFFSSFEYVHEDASIAYSPDSLAQFNALASLAAQGLIPGVSSIAVPNSVPVPFRDYLATARLDWAQSSRSQWFLRLASDSYLTHNDLVQQATLSSTGVTSHSNYLNLALSQQHMFNPSWLGSFIFDAGSLHHTERRNANLGFALAFPFSSTARTISGFETFGDNQFLTPIAAFPVLRNQQKYQFRYDVSHASGRHAPRFGVGFIHEPVLSGALSSTAEELTVFGLNPIDYVGNPQQFTVDLTCTPIGGLMPTAGTMCSSMPASNGSFVQNVQRLGLYAQDSWRVAPRLTVSYGLRYDTTFGLFTASGRGQLQNPVFATLKALQIPFISRAPHDYRAAFAPRLGIAYALGQADSTVIRAGIGLYYNDLTQNGWVNALRAVNSSPGICIRPGDPGCIPPAAEGGLGAIIDPDYKTPYAIHATAGIQHSFNPKWTVGADWTHEEGVHAYRRYNYQAGFTLISPLFPSDPTDQMNNVPNVTVFRTDNRSRYDGMSIHLQGNVSRRFNLIVNYTLASAETWGCVLGELFDYVNGVCDPLHAFAKGDYGPSGEDVRHRLVVAGTFYVPGGFQVATLSQAESARPFTLSTTVDVNGLGDTANDRAVVNGVQTSLDEFRGTPYVQIDLRVSRPFTFHDRWSLVPFMEFFNLLNRSNPGNNYVTNVAALPVPVGQVQAGNITDICVNPACTTLRPITSPNQLRQPAGALGDFFGPGTTVGIPFAAQLGVRLSF